MAGISIIVCCYNSENRIHQTLQSIFELDIPKQVLVQLIIVNNNSTDNTLRICRRICSNQTRRDIETTIVTEEVPGLRSARMRGINESIHDVYLFCDDDNHLDRQYLTNTFDILKRDSQIGIIGGWCRPKFKSYPGKWIEECYVSFATEPKPKSNGYKEWVFGAGMIVKKEVIDTIESRNIKLSITDRVGEKYSSGGDAEMCILARFVGYKIYYSDQLMLDHAIDNNRLSRIKTLKINTRNVDWWIDLYCMEQCMEDKYRMTKKIYLEYFKKNIRIFIVHFSRSILKRKFYSTLTAYKSFQILIWLIFNFNEFKRKHSFHKLNLYKNGE